MGQNGKKRLKTFTKNTKGLELNSLEIKDLKVGDEVYVNYWSDYYDYWSKKTIKNITPKGFISVDGVLFKNDGYSRSAGARIYPLDDKKAEAEYMEYVKRKFVKELEQEVSMIGITYEQAVKIKEILEDNEDGKQ